MYFQEFLIVTTIAIIAAVSPGPDFIVAIRNSLIYSRSAGIYTAIGIGLGVAVHVTYSLTGLGLLIKRSDTAFNIIKYLGAIYLVYVGLTSLLSSGTALEESELVKSKENQITPGKALWTGFLTNVLNPKASLFFLSLFTQIVSNDTPLSIQIGYGVETIAIVCLWFIALALLLSHKQLRQKISTLGGYLQKTMGALLIGLAVKIAVSSR